MEVPRDLKALLSLVDLLITQVSMSWNPKGWPVYCYYLPCATGKMHLCYVSRSDRVVAFGEIAARLMRSDSAAMQCNWGKPQQKQDRQRVNHAEHQGTQQRMQVVP